MDSKQPIHTKIWSLDESMVRHAPEAPGVYALWKEGRVIYYGRACGDGATIKSCLIEHISGMRGATHYLPGLRPELPPRAQTGA